MKTKKNNLTQTERNLIFEWKNLGKSNKAIAKRLGRSCSTIGRELKRNGWKKGIYEPLHAQVKAEKRKEIISIILLKTFLFSLPLYNLNR